MNTSYNPPARRSDLAIPSRDYPSIAAHRVHNATAPVAPYGAPSWPLAALDTGDRSSKTINFTDWPQGFQDFARQTAYALINHGTPESLLDERSSKAVQWPSPGTIRQALYRLRSQVMWLTTEWSEANPLTPVRCPGDLDAQHLDDLKAWIEGRYADAHMRSAHLADIVRVWHLSPWLPEDSQWPEPSWRLHNWRPKRRNEENKTVRIGEQTFSPILEWAIAFVTNFAPDILTAQSHYLKRSETNPANFGNAGECLDDYGKNNVSLPPKPHDVGGKPSAGIGWHVMQYRHSLPIGKFRNAYRGKKRKSIPIDPDLAQTALDVPISGLFKGRPWIPYIGVYDVTFAGAAKSADDGGPLVAHLRTACLIVLAALTGMRPEEVLNLQSECAPEPIIRPGGSRLQVIKGKVFKGVSRREDGSPGEPKEAVWATIPVAARAAHVAEQINEVLGRRNGLLFGGAGSVAIHTGTATGAIESFIEFVNNRLAPHTAAPSVFSIPSDADGAISLRRFRRTLAWFLRHRPNGDVTLAIQYQHVGITMGEGYAGTKASGMPDLLLEEDWNHRVDMIRSLGDLLADGEGVGGAAARRAVQATRSLPRPLLPADERRLRKDKSLTVYDNPAAIALCIFDESTALCRKLEQAGKDRKPDLLGCVDGCPNCARTDGHIVRLTLQTRSLRGQAELAPLPMQQSMLAQADRNERIVSEFGATRITLSGMQ